MSILKEAYDSICLYRSGYLETLDSNRKNSIIGKSLYYRFYIIFINTLKEFKLLFIKNHIEDIGKEIVCLINSKNNYQALQFLDEDNTRFIKITTLGKPIQNVETIILRYKFFFSLFFIISLPIILFNTNNRKYLILLHKSFGVTFLAKVFFLKNKPNKVIFSNDHIPEMRCYLSACKELELHTVYVQHAAVSKYFPPLTFNLSLLDSQNSLNIYKGIKGFNTTSRLIGIPKLDKGISKVRNRESIKIIGIAINQNDSLNMVKDVIYALDKEFFKIILRKHPADNRELFLSIDVVDGNSMSLIDFIHNSDFLIASDSSIHIESNSLKCRSLYYQLHNNDNKYDYYEFVKNKYIDEIKGSSDLVKYLKNFKYENEIFFSSKYLFYNSALRNGYYGKSSFLAKKIIYEGLDN